MSRAAASSMRWSYARSLILIFGPATMRSPPRPLRLLVDPRDATGADGPSALADREAEAFLHRDRRDQLDGHLHVVARHHHLHALGEVRAARHVGRPEVELRPVPVEERRVPSPLVL